MTVISKFWPGETSLREARIKNCLVEVGWGELGLSLRGRNVKERLSIEQRWAFSGVQMNSLGCRKGLWELGWKGSPNNPMTRASMPFPFSPLGGKWDSGEQRKRASPSWEK